MPPLSQFFKAAGLARPLHAVIIAQPEARVAMAGNRTGWKPMKQTLKALLGPNLQRIRTAQMMPKLISKSFGLLERECPICGYQGHFTAEIHFPDVYRFDAVCPQCTSLPRTRLLWLAIQRHGLVTPSDYLLHFAPEKSVSRFLRPMPGRYVTADLMDPVADLRINIEAIDLDDDIADVIVCSHVLEHVDDRRALKELFRILKPGGKLLAMVPMVDGWPTTYENPEPLDREQRKFHYGRSDHKRRYGRDFLERLAEPGFAVEEVGFGGAESLAYGLLLGENLYFCRKPLLAAPAS